MHNLILRGKQTLCSTPTSTEDSAKIADRKKEYGYHDYAKSIRDDFHKRFGGHSFESYLGIPENSIKHEKPSIQNPETIRAQQCCSGLVDRIGAFRDRYSIPDVSGLPVISDNPEISVPIYQDYIEQNGERIKALFNVNREACNDFISMIKFASIAIGEAK